MGDASDVADNELSCRKGKGGEGKEENGGQAEKTGEVTPPHQLFSDRTSVLEHPCITINTCSPYMIREKKNEGAKDISCLLNLKPHLSFMALLKFAHWENLD